MTLYERLVEAAAERAAETGSVDLVDLTRAAEAGFEISAFIADVERQLDNA